jgi:hypothetical protein
MLATKKVGKYTCQCGQHNHMAAAINEWVSGIKPHWRMKTTLTRSKLRFYLINTVIKIEIFLE